MEESTEWVFAEITGLRSEWTGRERFVAEPHGRGDNCEDLQECQIEQQQTVAGEITSEEESGEGRM